MDFGRGTFRADMRGGRVADVLDNAQRDLATGSVNFDTVDVLPFRFGASTCDRLAAQTTTLSALQLLPHDLESRRPSSSFQGNKGPPRKLHRQWASIPTSCQSFSIVSPNSASSTTAAGSNARFCAQGRAAAASPGSIPSGKGRLRNDGVEMRRWKLCTLGGAPTVATGLSTVPSHLKRRMIPQADLSGAVHRQTLDVVEPVATKTQPAPIRSD
jgi:hypothetical protein